MTDRETRTSRSSCAACGDPLQGRYYTLADRAERYCPRCMRERPRCDSCGAPVGEPHWQLHDGRVLCARCHATAVYSPETAERIYAETLAAVSAQLGLVLHTPVTFRLVDAPALARVRAATASLSSEKTLGLFVSDGYHRTIYVLYGLPLITFRTVVAHEIGHAWQMERHPQLQDETLREGFAEWVAFRHLLYLGCSRAAQQMLTASHPYRPFLEQMLAVEQASGPRAVLLTVGEIQKR